VQSHVLNWPKSNKNGDKNGLVFRFQQDGMRYVRSDEDGYNIVGLGT